MKSLINKMCAIGILAIVLLVSSCNSSVSGIHDKPDNNRGSDSTEQNQSNDISYVWWENVEDGIQFSGNIWHNQNIKITIHNDTDNINMISERSYSGWEEWRLTYPFVEKGKTYNFTVTAAEADFKIYEEAFTIKAEGGLGEFKITNVDESKIIMTDDKILKKAAPAKYTDNPNINIQQEAVFYNLRAGSGQEIWHKNNYYFDETLCLVDQTDGRLDLKKPFTVAWSSTYTYKIDEKILNGNNLFVWAGTRLKISGFTYNSNVFFEMNDFSETTIPWGGEKAKCLIAYGIVLPESWKYIISKDDFESIKDQYEISNMPGDQNSRSFTQIWLNNEDDDEDDQIETEEYIYTQVLDGICTKIKEPRITPTLKSKDGNTKYRFTGWNYGFPATPSTEKGLLNNKDAFITRIYAYFEIVE